MGRKLIKQPNNKYSIFSSIVDDFIVWNATEKEIIDFYVEEEIERAKKYIAAAQTTEAEFKELLDDIKKLHGDERYNEIKKDIEQ